VIVTTQTNVSLLSEIEAISSDGLDPLHTREALVLKMRRIYSIAAQARDDAADTDEEDDDGNGE
jgi:hypothetical protein